jgi:hypothetical protein
MGVTVNHWLVEFDPLMRSQMHSVALRCGRMCLSILGTKPLKLQLEFSHENIASDSGLKVFMDAHKPVTLEEGDRYPLGPPSCNAGLV